MTEESRLAQIWSLRRWWLYPALFVLMAFALASALAAGWTFEPFQYVLF